MPSLNYASPTTINEAVALLAGATGQTKLLSGGTDLLVQLRSGRAKPDLIVDTKKIPGIMGIREEAGGFVIGAATPGAEIEAHEALKRAYPGVVEAMDLIGSTQIQGRATLVGNLCNASPAADSVPAMIAVGATAVIVGSKGKREVPVEAVIVGPGRTSLAKDEFILEIRLPKPAPRDRGCLSALHPAHRDGHRGGRLRHQRHAGCERRMHGGEGVCRGGCADRAACAGRRRRADRPQTGRGHAGEAGCRGAGACKPISDKRGTIEYRIKVAGVLARRAAAIAFERAQGQDRPHRARQKAH